MFGGGPGRGYGGRMSGAVPPRIFPSLNRPLIFGHRGASMYAPENTWESFDLAVRLGADVLETDVRLSRDGEVVLFHDVDLGRTTDGRGPVAALRYAELAALDAGHHFEPTPAVYPFRGRGVRVPRLSDMLAAFPQAAFNIEIKQRGREVIRAVLAVLQRAGPVADRIVLAAGDDHIMSELEAARPGCALGLSRRQALAVIQGVYWGGVPPALAGRALQIPPRHWGLPLVTRRLAARCKAAGIDVHVWTVNDPRQAERLLHSGVDGVITDDPGAILAVAAPWRGQVEPRLPRIDASQ